MRKRTIVCMLLMSMMLLFCSFTQAEEVTTSPITATVETVTTQMGEDVVSYPQLSDMDDVAVQAMINSDIILTADIGGHIVTLTTLQESTWGLQVDFTTYMQGDLFCVVIEAEGKMTTGRQGHQYTALCYNLQTGERLTLDDLFTDANEATVLMEAIAEPSLQKSLSEYVEKADILPLPVDSFGIDAYGITFYYDSDQFALLDGTSGACQFFFSELAGQWRTEEESIPSMLGFETTVSTVIDVDALQAVVEAGAVDTFPVQIGTLVTDITSEYALLRTPDQFPMGCYLTFSDAIMREVRLITDLLSDGQSVVEGIQWQRGALEGLVINLTTREAWQEALGNPTRTIDVEESLSYDYDLPVGHMDIYVYGDHELRLHANEEGVLVAIQINISKI